MEDRTKSLKIILIAALVLAITLLHYLGISADDVKRHMLAREIYFIPIMLASFWFGLPFGLITSGVVSLIYLPHLFVYDDAHGTLVAVISHILVFNLVAMVMGWLVDRRNRQHKEALAIQNEAVLGRAAAAVGHEMKDLLGTIKSMTHQGENLQCTTLDRDFKQEITRLEGAVEALSSIVPRERLQLISRDINEVIRERLEHHNDTARKAGITLETHLDEKGCPAQADTEQIGWIVDNLVKNAVEASASGQTIQIHSHRGGTSCQVEIQDQGPGIPEENLSKIFTPFFTTKNTGHGLSLAVSKKIMRDLGGELQVASKYGEGATFTLSIPRENGRAL